VTRPSIRHRLEFAVSKVCEEVKALVSTAYWRQRQESDLWYELVACTLGSQVRHEHSLAAVRFLDTNGLLDITRMRQDGEGFERKIAQALSQPICPSRAKLSGARYRFPHSKAKQIRRTAEAFYSRGPSIGEILQCSKTEKEARSKIMSNAVGIGPKQASLFLRNIGYTDSLAILDTHVLKYMELVGVFSPVERAWCSLAEYEHFEGRLQTYAERFHEKLAYLDTAIWVVMRVFKWRVAS